MNIRSEISGDFDYKKAHQMAQDINSNPVHFSTLMELFYQGNIRITQRVTWVITYCLKYDEKIILPHLPKMISSLEDDSSNAIKRNVTRTLQFISIPKKLMGRVFNNCFNLVSDPKTATAVKAFSMTVLYNICASEPELKNEVTDLIKLQLPHGTSGIKARAKKIIQQLKKLN